MENKLVKLSLKGFKSISEVELNLKNLNVLIGANGSGKSNLIAFFRMLSAMMSGKLQFHVGEQGGASKLLHDGPKRTRDIEATLGIQTDSDFGEYRFRLSHASDDVLIFAEEQCQPDNWPHPLMLVQESMRIVFSGGREARISSSSNTDLNIMKAIRQIFHDFVVYHFQDTSKESRIKNKSFITDNVSLKHDAANLGAFLLRLREEFPRYYFRIVDTIRLVLPFFEDFVLEPEVNSLLLRWRESGSDMIFAPDQGSDGTLRAMALVTLLLQPPQKLPAFLVIDEPELGLHPTAITIIGELIKAASQNTQVLIATQSPSLLDQFEPEDVLVVEREGRGSVYRRLEKDTLSEWIAEYALSDLWNKNILGGRP